ncbi:MAG: hypothetical protein QXM99_06195 [Thermofilum sp.]
MSARSSRAGEILLVLEAAFGGFYVSIARALFVPMLTYSGYPLELLSMVILPTGFAGAVLSLYIYRHSGFVSSKFKPLLFTSHIGERLLWVLPPFLLASPAAESIVYMLGNLAALTTGLLLSALIFLYFPERDVVRVAVSRSASGAAASLLGSLYMTYLPTVMPAPDVYYVLYLSAFAAGVISSISLALVPNIPSSIPEPGGALPEEVAVKSGNAFLVLMLMTAGGNLVGIAWSPLLKALNAPLYIPLALSLAGNLGALLGSYAWRGYRSYLAAMLVNSLFTALVPFFSQPEAHPLLSFAMSATFMGANLLGMQLFAQLSGRMGRVKASVFQTSSNYVGLLLAASLSTLLPMSPQAALLAAALIKLLGVVVAAIAIPETAIVKGRRVYEYSRLVYSTSLYGFTFTVQASREFLKTMLEMLATVALIVLIYVVHRLSTFLAGA